MPISLNIPFNTEATFEKLLVFDLPRFLKKLPKYASMLKPQQPKVAQQFWWGKRLVRKILDGGNVN